MSQEPFFFWWGGGYDLSTIYLFVKFKIQYMKNVKCYFWHVLKLRCATWPAGLRRCRVSLFSSRTDRQWNVRSLNISWINIRWSLGSLTFPVYRYRLFLEKIPPPYPSFPSFPSIPTPFKLFYLNAWIFQQELKIF